MNVYIEKSKKLSPIFIRKVLKFVSDKGSDANLCIHISDMKYIRRCKDITSNTCISSITYLMPINKLSNSLIKAMKKSNRALALVLIVDRAIDKKIAKKIKNSLKMDTTIFIYDISNVLENEVYYNQKNVVYYLEGSKGYNSELYNMLGLVCGLSSSYSCRYSSCLGNNIFIDSNGDAYFCKKYNKKICNIMKNDIELCYNNCEEFKNILFKAIEKRNNCKKECKLFNVCKGGCPYEDDSCSRFNLVYTEALQMYIDIVDNYVSLDEVHTCARDSILWGACSKFGG